MRRSASFYLSKTIHRGPGLLWRLGVVSQSVYRCSTGVNMKPRKSVNQKNIAAPMRRRNAAETKQAFVQVGQC